MTASRVAFHPRRCCGRRSATMVKQAMADEKKLYRAEYMGSGTFRVTKPKRKPKKQRQTRVKNRQRGARK